MFVRIFSHEDQCNGLDQQDQIMFVVLNLANKIRSTFDAIWQDATVQRATLSCNVLFLDKVADEDTAMLLGSVALNGAFMLCNLTIE